MNDNKVKKLIDNVKKCGNKKLPSVCFWALMATLTIIVVFSIWKRELIQNIILSYIPEPFSIEFSIPAERAFAFSPLKDEDVIAFTMNNGEIWVADKNLQNQRKLIWPRFDEKRTEFEGIEFYSPLDWSPDGTKIVFKVLRGRNKPETTFVKPGPYIFDSKKNKIDFISPGYTDVSYIKATKGIWSPDSRYYAYLGYCYAESSSSPKGPTNLLIYDTIEEKYLDIELPEGTIDREAGIKGWDNFHNLYYLNSLYLPAETNGTSDSLKSIISINVNDKQTKTIISKKASEGKITGFIVDANSNNIYFDIDDKTDSNYIYQLDLSSRDLQKKEVVNLLAEGIEKDELTKGMHSSLVRFSPQKDKFFTVEWGAEGSAVFFIVKFSTLSADQPDAKEVKKIYSYPDAQDYADYVGLYVDLLDWYNNDTLLIDTFLISPTEKEENKLLDIETLATKPLLGNMPRFASGVAIRPTFAIE